MKVYYNMKRKVLISSIFIFSFLLLLPIFLFGCNSEKTLKNLTCYNLDLEYNDSTNTLSGTEKVDFVNNYNNMFTSLYFHLYPNAFREGAKASVVSSANEDEAYPNGLSYGNIVIKNVTSENSQLNFSIEGSDENILIIDLDQEVYPDENIILNIEFEITLANINHRLGKGNNTINFGNFYPILCVYEDGKGFSQELYHSNGDPFYSEMANYDVQIKYSNKYNIASTGTKESSTSKEEKIIDRFTADNVRDFCFVLSEKFDMISQTVDGITVNYFGYQNDDNLQSCLKVSVDALQTFNNLFGKYPYSQLNIVKANFVHGGMEYPQLVLISDKYNSQEDLDYVIVHEIAHQWWYSVVGNDQYNHAWMDEGLAEYSTLMFFRESNEYGQNFEQLIKNANESYKLFEKVFTNVTGSVDGTMDRGLDEFNTEPEYVQCTYTKGVLLFNTIEESVGEKKFLKALKTYYKDFMFRNAMPADMIDTFIKVTGYDLEDIFFSYIEGKVIIK